MPTDAENVTNAHLLIRRTFTLAARGMELQQRDRIAMMLNKHRVAIEGCCGPPKMSAEDLPSATWERHGAEPLIMNSVLYNLREAAAESEQTSSKLHSSTQAVGGDSKCVLSTLPLPAYVCIIKCI